MGYQVNRYARSMVTGRTDAIDLWLVSQPATAWASMILFSRLIEACNVDGYGVLLSSIPTQYRLAPDRPLPDLWPADCRIAFACENFVSRYIQDHPQDRRIIHCSNQNKEGLDWVEVNLGDAGYRAAKHLVDIGCRNIIHFQTHYIDQNPDDTRLLGYKQAMDEAGLPHRVHVCEDETQSAGFETMKALLDAGGKIDGLVCRRDELAIGACLALQSAGLSIPKDVAVVGFNGIAECEQLSVPLTTLRMPLAEIADAAWELAKRRIEEPESAPRHLRVDYQFVHRASTQR